MYCNDGKRSWANERPPPQWDVAKKYRRTPSGDPCSTLSHLYIKTACVMIDLILRPGAKPQASMGKFIGTPELSFRGAIANKRFSAFCS